MPDTLDALRRIAQGIEEKKQEVAKAAAKKIESAAGGGYALRQKTDAFNDWLYDFRNKANLAALKASRVLYGDPATVKIVEMDDKMRHPQPEPEPERYMELKDEPVESERVERGMRKSL